MLRNSWLWAFAIVAFLNAYGTQAQVQWSKWSRCSVKCGAGIQTRHRIENKIRRTVSRTCQRFACNEGWSGWSSDPCSVTCGNGFYIRRRTCRSFACRRPRPCVGPLCNRGPRLYSRRNEVEIEYKSCKRPNACADYNGLASCRRVEEFAAIEEQQLISTPNYPGIHQSNLNCSWRIFSLHPEGSVGDFQVEVKFSDIQIDSCCDSLTVRDGLGENSKIIDRLRNDVDTPYSFISSAGGIYITFTSQLSSRPLGFQVSYQLATRNATCWRDVTAPLIIREFIPSNVVQFGRMTNNTHCSWTIRAYPYMRVNLIIRLITTTDLTEVEDGEEPTANVFVVKIGRTIEYLSTSQVLRFRFPTNISYNTQGFIASYRSVPREGVQRIDQSSRVTDCHHSIQLPMAGHRSFSTLRYGRENGNNYHCSWVITSPPATRIFTWFSFVHLDSTYDWIKVFDGHFSNSTLLDSFSASQIGFRFYNSSDRYLRIEFRLINISDGRGFTAFSEIYNPNENPFSSTCRAYGEHGGVCANPNDRFSVEETFQTISSPFWPKPYGKTQFTYCEWFLKTNNNEHRVHLQLISLSIHPRDSLEIHGHGPNLIRRRTRPWRYMGQRGQSNTTLTFTSSCDVLVVRLNINSFSNYGGFRAIYKQEIRAKRETIPNFCTLDFECPFRIS